MKNPVEHKCLKCGNVYYYRKVKQNKRCPACRGPLRPVGYRWIDGPGHMGVWIPVIPVPPMPERKPPKPEPVTKYVRQLPRGMDARFHDYCNGCAEVEPDAINNSLYADSEQKAVWIETIITCKHYERCALIKKHIDVAGKDGGDPIDETERTGSE